MAVDVDLGTICVQVTPSKQLCVTFPGGVEVCATMGLAEGDTSQAVRSFFGALQSTIAPLQPVLSIIDVVLSIVDCVKAIPAAVGLPPDPTKLFQAIPKMLAAVAKIAGIPLGVPKMIKQIVAAIVEGVLAVLGELEALLDFEADLQAAAEAAALPGNEVLVAIHDCEAANYAIEIANMSGAMQPVNRLIGVVNLVLSATFGVELPTFDSLGASAGEAIESISATLEVMSTILGYIPG